MRSKPNHLAHIRRDIELGNQTHALKRPVFNTHVKVPMPSAAPIAQMKRQPDPLEIEKNIEELRSKAYEQGLDAGTKEGYSHGKEIGFTEGKEEGFQAGLIHAKEMVEAAIIERTQQLELLIQSIQPAYLRRLASLEDDMLELVHCAIIKILGDQVMLPLGIRQIVQTAIHDLCARELIAIRLHPDDLAALKTSESSMLFADDAAYAGVTWLADKRIALGGCIVDTPDGSLDARLETQLSVLTEALLKTRMTRSDTSESDHGLGEQPQ